MGSANPFKNLYKPLYGSVHAQPAKKSTPTPEPKAASQPVKTQPVSPPPKSIAPKTIKDKGLALYEGIVSDKKTLMLVIALIVILIVVGYLIYKQKQQKKYLTAMARRLKKLKKHAR